MIINTDGLSPSELRAFAGELLEMAKRLEMSCRCGVRRREIIINRDERFEPRRGCLTCNRWDGPPRLVSQ